MSVIFTWVPFAFSRSSFRAEDRVDDIWVICDPAPTHVRYQVVVGASYRRKTKVRVWWTGNQVSRGRIYRRAVMRRAMAERCGEND